MMTNILNPKVALFFLALLPQFVDRSASQPALGFILLGLTFIITGTIWCIILACFAAFIRSHIQGNKSFGTILYRRSGTVFIGLGLVSGSFQLSGQLAVED